MPPLFRITTKVDNYIYLRDADALEKYKAEHPGQKYELTRNKGLGEMDASELGPCLLEPETRHVEQIAVSDIPATDDMFDMFMGPVVTRRREYILEHSEEAEEND